MGLWLGKYMCVDEFDEKISVGMSFRLFMQMTFDIESNDPEVLKEGIMNVLVTEVAFFEME